jgi:poly[(R)-3-hydroxyalkanoate] polymerase subunit PhaC
MATRATKATRRAPADGDRAADAEGRARRAGGPEDAAREEVGAQAVEAMAAAEDVGGVGAGGMLADLGRVLAAGPGVARETAGLGVELARVALGRSTVEFNAQDKRFADPTWRENPAYRRLGQSYLAWSQAVERAVQSAEVDWRTAERARFGAGVLTGAMAPTNTFVGNPAAVKRAFETGGKSLLRGARNMIHDLRHNGGMPSQVDARPFKIGENVAVTPGAVVYRDEVFELLQYTPTTERVRARPMVIIPPQINKYYFLDLAAERSFVQYAVSQGVQTFCISWRNPGREHGEWDLDTYVTRCLQAVDVARDVTDSDDANTMGFCAGGITQAAMLSKLAAENDRRVNAAGFSVTLLDFSVPAMIGMWQSPRLLSNVSERSRKEGVLDGAQLAKAFAWLRPNDLVFNYVANNYLLGNDPPAFDILAWNADCTNLPGALHGQFLDIFGENHLCRPGSLSVLGTPVDLSTVTCDTFATGALTDHLTPWKGCYRTTQLLGGRQEFVLSSSGHIQSLVNPPGNPKMYYYTGPDPGPDPDAWREQAHKHTGSWWERWAEWTLERSGPERDAPEALGSSAFPPLEAAPGRYIRDHNKGAPVTA